MNMKWNMKNWKKNMIAAAVLLVVCAGIYMNWMYSNTQDVADLTDKLDADKVMSDDSLMLEVDGVIDDVQDTITDYFAAVRLSRQQARDNAVELLQETIAYEDGSESAAAAATSLDHIVSDALAESQIESLIIAKGYEDCVAYIGEEGISIAVSAPAEGLEEADVALISDIVTSQTEFSVDDIRIIEVK